MSANWINTLNASASRLHKEATLQKILDAARLGNEECINFLTLARKCYDPFVTFGVKQVPDTVGIIDTENPWAEFDQLLDQLAQRALTGNAARDAIVAMSDRFDSAEWNALCAPVIRRDLRAGISVSTINKICKKTAWEVPVFGCQLASNCEGRPEMRGKKRLDGKLDGCRSLVVVTISGQNVAVTFNSRNGKVFENFGHIEEQVAKNALRISTMCDVPGHTFKNGFVLDGEVMGQSFQALMRQARRKTDADAEDSVLNLFDIIPLSDFLAGRWNAPQKKRIKILESMRHIIDDMPNVELVPGIEVDLDTAAGQDQMKRFASDQVNAGLEGIMIKDLDAPYTCKRSSDWMKWKPVHDYDLTVIGVEEGTGKNAGKLGALVCEGVDDGKHIVVNCGSGYTDQEREDYWNDSSLVIGRTAVVMADAVTLNQNGSYSLRFPRFKTFRDDK